MRATSRHIAVDGDGFGPPIPVLTLEAEAPGPCAVITANVHGDEVTGLVAVHRLAERLGDELRCGRVVLFPTLNPGGLAAVTRAVPADGGDLNRCFPGRKRGRVSERLAELAWRTILGERPDVVVDLHADSATAIPYALLDRPVSLPPHKAQPMSARLSTLGEATGLTVVREYPQDLYLRYALDRSLAGALVNRAEIPAITIEAGPRRQVDASAVSATVAAVRGVLGALGLVSAKIDPHPTRSPGGPWRRAAAPRAHATGWFAPVVPPGARFREGALLGEVRHVDGRVLDEVRAARDGIVLSWAESAWTGTGSVVGTLGVPEDG